MLGFSAIAQRFFGSSNERKLRPMQARVAEINALEPRFQNKTDDELRAMTAQYKERLAKDETLDDLLPEAFATVREAAKRTLGQRHFDVQLVGGMVLHEGNIAEMKTGEGKTLVATLPVYLNALAGEGVHVVTVNDYLARRDAEWMGQIYRFLGLTVGCIVHGLTDDQRRESYACDVTYGTNNEFGFDYLRDNMKYSIATMVQRGHSYAIVDEVDSILVDEARTPLIISGPTEDRTELYKKVDALIPLLTKEDYEVDEKQRQTTLTDAGNEHMVQLLRLAGLLESGDLYDIENISTVHHVNQALKAHKLFQKDKDYIVKNSKVIIIDEFTGRMMEGRRYSDGLHQALEAKEDAVVEPENVTLASITFQNYFRLYDKLAGMTGTAMTEAAEFMDIYRLDVLEVPTNVLVQRIDHDDEVYRTFDEKNEAIVKLVEECRKRNQPVLVGTTSIEKSELLSELMKKRKIPHSVLNARYHEQEAMIVSQAGRSGAVTIATNMAGRGTDIQLGGNLDMRVRNELGGELDEAERARRTEEIRAEIAEDKKKALAAGGLYVVGTERHESRRIDNQLRGRSGRQGDPGASKFFLSLQDDLMRIFGSERMDSILVRLGLEPGEAITHPWVNKALEKAQQKVEARNFEMRKNILKYDNVLNDQRKVVFEQRKEIMSADEVSDQIVQMREEVVEELVARHIPEKAYAEQWGRGGAARGGVQDLRPRSSDRRLDERGRHRRRGSARARPQGGRDARRRACGQFRSRHHALCREGDPAADAGSRLARAHRQPRPPAPVCRPARLRSARPAERVQERGLHPVRGPALQAALRRRDAAHAHPDQRPAAARAQRARPARAARLAHQRLDRRGRGAGLLRPDPAAAQGRGRRPEQSADLGQGAAQRGLPLRLGPQVQALPRGAGLTV